MPPFGWTPITSPNSKIYDIYKYDTHPRSTLVVG